MTIAVPRRKVLLVEDDFYVASALALCLETDGVEVVGPVGSATAALDLIASEEGLDGAVLDINLKGKMAYPIAERLRELGVPYVYTTGYDAESVTRRDPTAPCFEKPVIASRLLEALFGSPS